MYDEWFRKLTLVLQLRVGTKKSAFTRGILKSNLKTALLQLLLLLVVETAPGFGYIGKSSLLPQPAQTDWYIIPCLSNRLVPPSTCSLLWLPPK